MVSRAGSVATAVPAAAPVAQRSALRPVVGVLADGTAFYAPIGEVVVDGPRVTCHLCGRSLRSVAAHLAAHGWTKEQYCEAFGLERGQSLEGPETRKLRAAALSARLVFRSGHPSGQCRGPGEGPARRADQGRGPGRPGPLVPGTAPQESRAGLRPRPGRRRGRPGQPGAGRPVPGRGGRRRGPAAGVLRPASAGAGPRRGGRQPGGDQPRGRAAQGLAVALPGAAGSRHGRGGTAGGHGRHDVPWHPALDRLGFPDVASYLRDRHAVRHWSVNAIAAEVGVSYHAVESALRRHG